MVREKAIGEKLGKSPGRTWSAPKTRTAPVDRLVDALIVLLLLPLWLPLGLLVAAIVFVDSPGSVFYRATRVGLGGRRFEMLKFRTMKSGSAGPGLTRPNDVRFTPVGRFLARSRLDEMPQIWNVLKGEMRLVGPRPEDPEFVSMHAQEYREVLAVAPGITGTTQLVHFLDALDDHNPLAYYQNILPDKVALDLRYVRNHSLVGDILILARTVLVPVRLVAEDLRSLIEAHQLHPNAGSRLAVGGTSFVVSIALLLAYLAAGGPTT